jgi:hypothetical protein
MKKFDWFERQFTFGLPPQMLPFYLERLSGTLSRIEKKVAGVSEEILSQKLDGKWSVKENIAHLAEVDEISLTRVGEMKKGISPMSPAVIQPGKDYNAQSIAEVLNFFKTRREQNLNSYKSLTDHDLLKSSLHPRLKVPLTPVDLAWFDAEHDDHHLVRINEILEAQSKRN